MNTSRRNIAICILVSVLLISGCGPGQLFGPTRFVSIAAGGDHTCMLTAAGGVKCWGRNEHGELGDGTNTQWLAPVDVVGLTSGVSAIAAGAAHTCALTSTGGVKCWGMNMFGEMGDGTTQPRLTPVDVVGLSSGVRAITAGDYHSCALTSTGGVKCWGMNVFGEMGDGTTQPRLTPVDVVGLSSGVTAIAAGGLHTCALTSNGGVKCWGDNERGQLGDGTTQPRHSPVDVSGLTGRIIAIAAGGDHTCALTSAGGVKCWGMGEYGELGDDDLTNRQPKSVDVVGLSSGVTAIAAGAAHTCALTLGAGVKCWENNNDGELGDGSSLLEERPVDVYGLTTGVSAISTGWDHTCALTSNGGIKCWGNNKYGQLGDGTTIERLTPVDVIGLSSRVSGIAAGGFYTCSR